jgi:hypothetical protein
LLLVVVVLFGFAFAADDARELSHQLNEHRSGLAVLAGALIALHLIASGLATLLVREPVNKEAERRADPDDLVRPRRRAIAGQGSDRPSLVPSKSDDYALA